MKKLTATFPSLCMVCFAMTAQADWTLNTGDSTFTFSSIKKNTVYETHTFNSYQGSIAENGDAELALDLTSVNTGIAIRDERMKTMLFNTEQFTTAKYHVSIDPEVLADLKAGERKQITAEGSLSLSGINKKQTAVLNIFKLTDSRILVSTAKPVVIKAADYALDKGVEALQNIAKLPSISTIVPVNFSLVFDQE